MPTAINQASMIPFFAAVEQAALARVHELDLSFRLGWDFEEFAEILTRASGVVSPTFNPAFRAVEPGSIWAVLEDGAEVVSTAAFAYFAEGDVASRVRDQSIWFDREEDKVAEIGTVHPFAEPLEAPFMIGGGVWLAPEWRGIELGYVVNTLCKHHFLRHMPINHVCGLAMDGTAQKISAHAYDYPQESLHLLLEGYPPPFTTPKRMYAMHLTRDAAIERLVSTAVARLGQSSSRKKTLLSSSTTQMNRIMRPVESAIGSQRRS